MPVPRVPSVDELQLLLSRARSEGASMIVLERIACLLFYRAHGESVAAVCRQFGIARGTFYRTVHVLDIGDWKTLCPASRSPRNLPRTHLPQPAIERIRIYRQTLPTIGKEAIRLRLAQEHDVHVSASAIGRLIAREKLFFADSLLHERKRGEVGDMKTVGVQRYAMQLLGIGVSVLMIVASLMLGMKQEDGERTGAMPSLHTAAREMSVPNERP